MNVYDAKALGITDNEIAGVKELRRRLGHRFKPEDPEIDLTCLRFLRARDGNINKSENMLRTHLDYREKFNVDNAHLYDIPEVGIKFFPGGLIGFSKFGSPVYYAPMGNLDFKGGFKSLKKIHILESATQKSEELMKLMRVQSDKLKRDIYQITSILDFENFSLTKATSQSTLEMAILLLSLYEAHLPERLEICYVINVSSYFMALYSIVKPVLAQRTLSKVKFFGKHGFEEEFRRIIDSDILPAFLGGNRYDPPGDPRCTAFLNPSGPIPTSYYLRNPERRLINKQNVSKLVVPRSSKDFVTLEISEPDSCIRWEFETEKGDIAFGIRSLTYRYDSELNPVQDKPERVESDVGVESGSYHCEKAGKYRLIFDNSYSWFKEKKVYYRIEVVKPNGESYFVTE